MASTRLQVLDPKPKFSCGACGACCAQPWGVVIEAEKAHALDQHDFSAYPQLQGRRLYRSEKGAPPNTYILEKGAGVRCIFLDEENLCIIHKELGPEAKPYPCLKFPYNLASTATDDRISVDYGCPSVQVHHGKPLEEQVADIQVTLAPSHQPARPSVTIALDPTTRLSQPLANALLDRLSRCFAPAAEGDLWERFARALITATTVRRHRQPVAEGDSAISDEALITALASDGALPNEPAVPSITAFANPLQAPSPTRLLFAATVFRDTVPNDATMHMSFWRRLTLLPKLMSLARFSGVYASKLLERNLAPAEVMGYAVPDGIDPEAESLLCGYMESRLWQRYLAGSRLSIVAGLHQHIHDFNAIIFLARAQAMHQGRTQLTLQLIREALTWVEFHFSNQPRLFEQNMVAWFQTQLQSAATAAQSLRLMSLVPAPAPVAQA